MLDGTVATYDSVWSQRPPQVVYTQSVGRLTGASGTYHRTHTVGSTYHRTHTVGPTYHRTHTVGPTYHRTHTVGPTYHSTHTVGPTYHCTHTVGHTIAHIRHTCTCTTPSTVTQHTQQETILKRCKHKHIQYVHTQRKAPDYLLMSDNSMPT